MTVAELIAELREIPDQGAPVAVPFWNARQARTISYSVTHLLNGRDGWVRIGHSSIPEPDISQ